MGLRSSGSQSGIPPSLPTATGQGWAQPPPLGRTTVRRMARCEGPLARAVFRAPPVQHPTLHHTNIHLYGRLCSSHSELRTGGPRGSATRCENCPARLLVALEGESTRAVHVHPLSARGLVGRQAQRSPTEAVHRPLASPVQHPAAGHQGEETHNIGSAGDGSQLWPQSAAPLL